MSAARAVLDSFALLAFLRGAAGEGKIAALLERAGLRDEPAHMTEVNFYLWKDGYESGRPVSIREGLIVSDVRAPAHAASDRSSSRKAMRWQLRLAMRKIRRVLQRFSREIERALRSSPVTSTRRVSSFSGLQARNGTTSTRGCGC